MPNPITESTSELYRRHRPKLFKEVVGQPEAVSVMVSMLKRGTFPHAVLFSGPSGTGKTTLARIVASKLECGAVDLVELNAADTRGIDTIREIGQRVRSYPMNGKTRIWIIDEAQKLTPDAQNILLKVLEELPAHAYIFLATTDPQKLIRTIITRCTEIRVRDVTGKDMQELLVRVAKAESIALSKAVSDQILEHCGNSPRMALVLLNKIAGIEDQEAQLEAVIKGAHQAEAIQLARALFDPRGDWPTVAKILSTIQDEPEGVRHLVMAYARSILLKPGRLQERAAQVIEAFQFHFWDSKQAGLALAAFKVMCPRR